MALQFIIIATDANADVIQEFGKELNIEFTKDKEETWVSPKAGYSTQKIAEVREKFKPLVFDRSAILLVDSEDNTQNFLDLKKDGR